jgi:Peptidase family M28
MPPPRPTAADFLDEQWHRALLGELCSLTRETASCGEHAAARWLLKQLATEGADDVCIEGQRGHETFWWPLGLASAAGVLAGVRAMRGRSLGAAALGAGAAWAAVDELPPRRRRLRAVLPRATATNVMASLGPADARRTLVLAAHHDAAHSGLVFHPALGQIGPRLFPQLHERSKQTLPILYGVWLGPVITALGALLGRRRLLQAGVTVSLGASAAMLDIARAEVVPGANDNLSAVGVLLAVARSLQSDPVRGVRVLLISTGSEESFSEGMQAFGRRHFSELDPARTEFLCLECLGGPTLIVLEAEGMLKMRQYPPAMRESLAQAAAAAGVPITRGIRTVAATDAIIALRAGYPTATLASVAETKLPLNYHWPTDQPDALHWETIEHAIAVCESFLHGRADQATLSPSEEEQPAGG